VEMKVNRRTLFSLTALLGLALFAPGVHAESDEAKRLMKSRDSERYEVKTEHSSTKAGAARVHVASSQAQVKKVITDYKNYAKFISKFEKAKVVGRKGDKTDVYLQVPILKGAAKIWAVVRFEPVKTVGGEEVLEGHMIKGNVKRLDAWWRVKKIDDKNTQLNLELLIVPKLPVPGSVVTGEVAYAADTAVMGSRDRAEGKKK
jgi:ribosome-associated toxin RatA of RatAB toxin-antitoxin module